MTFQPSEDSKASQRARLLSALRRAPVSTVAAREALGLQSPAARVMELRRLGHRIETLPGIATDAQGREVRCALYVLAGGAA